MASLVDPPGFLRQSFDVPMVSDATSNADATRDVQRYQARAMEIARGQLGTVFQTGIFLYFFVGNQLSLFSILFLASMGLSPFKALFAVEQVFASVSVPGVNLTAPKALYILLNLVGAAIVMWKVRAMGLLPLTSADWVSLLPTRHYAEAAGGSLTGTPM